MVFWDDIGPGTLLDFLIRSVSDTYMDEFLIFWMNEFTFDVSTKFTSHQYPFSLKILRETNNNTREI